MKAAGIYCRVSTSDQVQGTSLDVQEQECRAYAAAGGYEVVKVVREDRSGATLQRPGLSGLRDMAARHDIQALIVAEQDRISRSMTDTMVLVEEFEREGVELVFVREPREDTPEGRMLFGMKALFKEYERSKIRERAMRGKRARVQEGSIVTAPRATYGYRVERVGNLNSYVVSEAEAEAVRRMFRWYTRDGLSQVQIAAKLNQGAVPTSRGAAAWRSNHIGRVLANPAYMGEFHQRVGAEVLVVPIPAIVDGDTWQRAQARKHQNAESSPRNTRRDYLLRSRLICGLCGNRYKCTPPGKKRPRSYMCTRRASSYYTAQERCQACNYNAARLEAKVWDGLVARMSTSDILMTSADLQGRGTQDAAVAAVRAEYERLGEQLEQLEAGMARAFQAFKAGLVDFREFQRDQAADKGKLDAARARRAEVEKSLTPDGEVVILPDQTVSMDPQSGVVYQRLTGEAELEALGGAMAWAFIRMGLREPSEAQKARWLDWLGVRITVQGDTIQVAGHMTEFALSYMAEDLAEMGEAVEAVEVPAIPANVVSFATPLLGR